LLEVREEADTVRAVHQLREIVDHSLPRNVDIHYLSHLVRRHHVQSDRRDHTHCTQPNDDFVKVFVSVHYVKEEACEGGVQEEEAALLAHHNLGFLQGAML